MDSGENILDEPPPLAPRRSDLEEGGETLGSLREKWNNTANPSCAVCHRTMDAKIWSREF